MQRRYQVQFEGSGIALRGDGLGEPDAIIRGFFVNRVVRAIDSSEAVRMATAEVESDWVSGEYSHYGVKPTLSVENVEALGFWTGLKARNSGYIFHPGE